jgi:hypothetical protein
MAIACKHYTDYTKEELAKLPPLNVPDDYKEEYVFDGKKWIHDDLNY